MLDRVDSYLFLLNGIENSVISSSYSVAANWNFQFNNVQRRGERIFCKLTRKQLRHVLRNVAREFLVLPTRRRRLQYRIHRKRLSLPRYPFLSLIGFDEAYKLSRVYFVLAYLYKRIIGINGKHDE